MQNLHSNCSIFIQISREYCKQMATHTAGTKPTNHREPLYPKMLHLQSTDQPTSHCCVFVCLTLCPFKQQTALNSFSTMFPLAGGCHSDTYYIPNRWRFLKIRTSFLVKTKLLVIAREEEISKHH